MDVQPTGSDPDDPRKRLLLFAQLIERKFESGRAEDISPDTLRQIVVASIDIRKQSKDARARDILAQVEDRGYAALADYRSPENGFVYFSQLRRIASLIRSLEDS